MEIKIKCRKLMQGEDDLYYDDHEIFVIDTAERDIIEIQIDEGIYRISGNNLIKAVMALV